jgi:8-oxo-dGTP pyrophosphatase MutT (NUDIX family)
MLVHSAAMGARKLHLVPLGEALPSTGKGHKREQVAAVCYRMRDGQPQFLLVRTRRGRWTFPKGGVVSGMTRAESAALEAFEEAGVHGRIEEAPFVRFALRKRRKGDDESGEASVQAHLCEVTRLVTPEEDDRNPTWFSAVKTKRKLREGRTPQEGTGLARVVDGAQAKIRHARDQRIQPPDPLQKVQFEASESWVRRFIQRASLGEYVRRRTPRQPTIEFSVKRSRGKLLQLGPAREDQD